MNERWKVLSARIDALSLRERVFLFLSLVAVCVALADLAWLSPARQAHQRARQEFVAANAELQRLRDALREQPKAPNPARDLREQIARLKAQADEVERSIAMQNGPTRQAPGLQDLLAHFLRKQPALSLVQTSNLAPEPASGASVGAGAAPAAAAPPPAAGSAARVGPAVTRQGMQVTVAGPYADLVRFVQALETALPELRWGTMRLAATGRPAELTLQVYLVSAQP